MKFFSSSGLSINPTEVTALFFKMTKFRQQARVVQTLDSAIHWINHYLAHKYNGNQLRYPVGSDLCSG